MLDDAALLIDVSMFNICPSCGLWTEAPDVDARCSAVLCPHCGSRRAFRRLPLFVVTGASGVGKSTILETIWQAMTSKVEDVVCLEADTLWGRVPADSADKYSSYWNTWLDLAVAVHQSGRPVALFGTTVPENMESCLARPLVREIHYLALVLESAELERRLRARPAWRGSSTDAFVREMLEFNAWLRANAGLTTPPMTLLDVTGMSVTETGKHVVRWVRGLC